MMVHFSTITVLVFHCSTITDALFITLQSVCFASNNIFSALLLPQEVTIIFQECEVKVSKELSMFVLYQQLLG